MNKANARLLVVEDNEDDEKLILRAIKRFQKDIQVEIVRDGASAVKRLCERSNFLPDLVLLDWKLTKMMGAEVLKQVRADNWCKSVVIVVFSSSDGPDDIWQCHELGGNEYVVKPVDYETFLTTVQDIVARHCDGVCYSPAIGVTTTEIAHSYTAVHAAAS